MITRHIAGSIHQIELSKTDSAFLGYNWDVDLHENLMDPFRSAVERRATGTYCGTKYKLLADPLEKSIKNADL